jgi:hypothetical protein
MRAESEVEVMSASKHLIRYIPLAGWGVNINACDSMLTSGAVLLRGISSTQCR